MEGDAERLNVGLGTALGAGSELERSLGTGEELTSPGQCVKYQELAASRG